MKRRGQSTGSWGKPCDSGAIEGVQLLILMNCCLSVRYDLSQDKTIQRMLREDSRQERRMLWIMVLKAAVRLRGMRILRMPEPESGRKGCL